jgi:threonine synthase
MGHRWRQLVDEEFPPERSLLLRYRRAIEAVDGGVAPPLDDLLACSLSEGARALFLAEHRGVRIFVADESSLMATGTYKALDACVIAACARRAGLRRVVLSSGGNLGYALAAYARRSGLSLVFFHPASTLYKLDASNFDFDGARVVSVDLPERAVKSLAVAFARRWKLPHVPDVRWRLAASAVRAPFLLESAARLGERFDVLAQAMCAGYGPVGIYRCFAALVDGGWVDAARVPRFLGLQQDANAPMVRAWGEGASAIGARHVAAAPDRYLEPGLYNTNPEENYARLHDLIRRFGGELEAVSEAGYRRHEETLLGWFAARGLAFTRRPDSAEVLEKTGLITGAGLLEAIERGRVPAGRTALYLLTGGLRAVETGAALAPHARVDDTRPEAEWVEALGPLLGADGTS